MDLVPQAIQRARGSEGYTACQLALAMGCSKIKVWKRLRKVQPASCQIIRGNEAAAWSLDSLPEDFRARLARRAYENGRGIADFIAEVNRPWEPEQALGLALSEVADRHVEEARRLREAILPTVQRAQGPGPMGDECLQRGAEDYERIFGKSISLRQCRRLVDRTLRRDGGRDQLDRLELYLRESPARKTKDKTQTRLTAEFRDLLETIQACADANSPGRKELAAIWSETFEIYSEETGSARKKKLRGKLIDFLMQHAPLIARNKNALRVSFQRKYAKWVEAGGSTKALLDGRELKIGEKRAAEFPEVDKGLITYTAATDYRGRVAPAIRQLRGEGRLTGETVEMLPDGASRKSYVNRRLMNDVRPEVKMIRPYILGKKAIDDATASIERNPLGLRSMDVITGDDFTLNNYFSAPDDNGWFFLTRGQVILMIDCRSRKILAWSSQVESNPRSLVIRTLMNQLCQELGLPKTWLFEMGIFKNANLIKNAAFVNWRLAAGSWPDAKAGWEQIGVRFVHARKARAKPAELVGGLLQNLLDGKPGYCGRDERRDCPEATRRAKLDVEAKRIHPSEYFLSFDEWQVELEKAIIQYNSSPQEGNWLGGLSPDEAFEKYWPHDDPPTKFDATCWHLLAHYVSARQVGRDGIRFTLTDKIYRFFNERTGQDRGKTVLAWFDPEFPDFLGVTDLDGKNPYLVERAGTAPLDAGNQSPELKTEAARCQAHSIYPRARYRVLKAKFERTYRKNLVDAKTAAVAQEFQAGREKAIKDRNEQEGRAATLKRKADKQGVPSFMIRDDKRAEQALDMIEAAHREHEESLKSGGEQ